MNVIISKSMITVMCTPKMLNSMVAFIMLRIEKMKDKRLVDGR